MGGGGGGGGGNVTQLPPCMVKMDDFSYGNLN